MVMRRLILLVPLLVLLVPSRVLQGEAPPVQSGRFTETALDDWLRGTLSGVYVEGGDLRLQVEQSSGVYESQPFQAPFGLNAVVVQWHAEVRASQAITIEVRSSVDGQVWEEWQAATPRSAPGSGLLSELLVLRPFTSWLQYRALFESNIESPLLSDVSLIYVSSTAGPALVDIVARVPPAGPVALTPPPRTITGIDWGARSLGDVIERQSPRRIVLSEVAAPADDPNSAATIRALQWVAGTLLSQNVLPYHFLIDGMGTIYQGSGDSNVRLPGARDRAVEIALLSNIEAEGLSEAAQASLADLLAWLGDARAIAPAAVEVDAAAPQRLRDLLVELQTAMDRSTVRSRDYFAAGNPSLGSERVSLLNRGTVEAHAVLTALSGGREERRSITVPAGRRVDVAINSAFAAGAPRGLIVEANQRIEAERIQIVGHELAGSPAKQMAARAWYFSQASPGEGEAGTLFVMNPQEREVAATVVLFPDVGATLSRTLVLAPRSTQSLSLNEFETDSGFGLKVVASAPVVAEQSMLLETGAMYVSSGVHELSRNWLFAEGSTLEGYTTTLTLLNPWPQQLAINLRVLSEDGTSLERRYALGAERRMTIRLNSIVPDLPFAMEVTADRPIAAERILRIDNGISATASRGASVPATRWTFVEGSSAIPAEQFLLVINSFDQSVDVAVDYLLANGAVERRTHRAGAGSRLTIRVNDDVPDQPVVSAILVADRPVVAERTIYVEGVERRGAETSLGIPGE